MRWMTSEEAAARLGVKVATVYAYVSRGVLHSWRRQGSRTSLFDSDQVEVLARRGRPRRTSRPPALDFVIQTVLTTITDRDVSYRGQSALGLARGATFEDVANLLWTGEESASSIPWEGTAIDLPDVPGTRDRLRLAVILASAADPFRADLATPAVTQRARSLIATMTAAVPTARVARTPRLEIEDGRPPRRGTVAGRLWGRLAGVPATRKLVAALNAALVLLADHEMAVSTLASRVAASARADPYAVVLAGLGPLSGPLHGGAPRLARQLLASAAAGGPEPAVSGALETHRVLPGFGHLLYPDGDPRARTLLDLIRAAAPAGTAVAVAESVIATTRRRAGLEPNIDLALAVLATVSRMPEEAEEAIFTIARTAGWIAHGIEEYSEDPLRFRPRAVARG